MEKGLIDRIFIIAFGGGLVGCAHFRGIVGEVFEEIQLRVVRKRSIHVLHVADCAVNIVCDRLSALSRRALAKCGRPSFIGIKIMLDGDASDIKERHALLRSVVESSCDVKAFRLSKRLSYLLSENLLYILGL